MRMILNTSVVLLMVAFSFDSTGIAKEVVPASENGGGEKETSAAEDLDWLRNKGFALPMDSNFRSSSVLLLQNAKLTDMDALRLERSLKTLVDEIQNVGAGRPIGVSTDYLEVSSSEISPRAAKAFECLTVSSLSLNGVTGTNGLLAALAPKRGETGMSKIKIASSDVTDEGLKALAPDMGIQSLSFRDVKLTGDGFAHLKRPKVTNLTHLALIEMDIDRELLASVANCNAAYLTIAETKLEGDALAGLTKWVNTVILLGVELHPEALAHLKSCYTLRLDEMKLEPTALKHVADVDGLAMVSFENMEVTDMHLAHLADADKLDFVIFENIGLEYGKELMKHPLAQLQKSKKLKTLYFRNTPLEDRDMSDLRKVETLNTLSLSETGISDKGLLELAGHANLRKLTISELNVTANGVKELCESLSPKCEVKNSQ